MGCTSSAPNMPEIAANTSETNENDQTNDVDVKEETHTCLNAIHGAVESDINDAKDSDVLPTCDRLEENIQLARNSDSFTKIHNEEKEQEKQLSSVQIGEAKISEDECEQNRFFTVKEVVDQVILNHILEDIGQTLMLHHDTSHNEADAASVTEDKSPELLDESSDEKLEDNEGQENVEESTSPSQSDSNRSTRWEALADIAAELPPSLAVDPMTGQIYSLTK